MEKKIDSVAAKIKKMAAFKKEMMEKQKEMEEKIRLKIIRKGLCKNEDDDTISLDS